MLSKVMTAAAKLNFEEIIIPIIREELGKLYTAA